MPHSVTETPVVPVKELVLTRIFDAPREMVFQAWIDQNQLQKWWGPKLFTNPRCEIEPRIGGAIYIEMQAPDGQPFPMGGKFVEIDRPNRLVFTACAHFGDDNQPELEVINTVQFEDYDGKTKVILIAKVVKSTPQMAGPLGGMEEGWSGSLDKLKALIEPSTNGREIALSRTFNSSREVVFEAYTNPDHLVHWWGPDGFSITTYEFSATPGGIWRLCMHGPDGRDYHNRIVYIDVLRPHRLSYRHDSDKDTEPVTFETAITFERLDENKTRVNVQMLFESAENRDHVERTYHAVEGLNQHLANLAEYLVSVHGGR